MNDQVAALKEKGIKALAITGGIPFNELNGLLDNATYGNFKFLYLSPERLQQEIVQNSIKRMNVNLIAVDEAHCISQWGNDFRPAYKNIHIVKELHPGIPTIALTATATPDVLEDTIVQLQLKSPQVFKNSFVRDNLSYQIKKENDKIYRIEQLLKQNTGSAIVYVRSRSKAEEVSNHLNKLEITSTFFHGGISSEEKKKRLENWKNEQVSTMVATTAFGMGIDHANVRFVIHIQLPESLESYFQEAGRAGRDGEKATAIILYNEDDKRIVQHQFVEALPSTKDVKKLLRNLYNYFQVSYGEGEFTNHSFNFTEFCQTYQRNTLQTFNGLNTLDRLGVIELSKEFGRKSMLRFLVPSSALLKEFERNVSFSMVGKTILRMYGGIFDTANAVNLGLVARKMGMNVDKVVGVLKEMEKQDLLELKHIQTDASITFLLPREDDKTINPLSKEIEEIKEKKMRQVASVLDYVENNSSCNQLFLVRYFGETNNIPCGNCSYCLAVSNSKSKVSLEDISEKIMAILKESPQDSRSIIEKLNFAEATVLKVLKLLLDADRIELNVTNQYDIKSTK
jgi:ATP-dependent DNA helicase RecQ